nr:MAG TPA: hypothetical protein [Caudoviricetes sp.]
MNILFKRGVVVFSVLALLGTTYVGAISTARPVVISIPPVVRSTPLSKPVTKTSTPKSSTTRSTTKSSTENKTTNVTNNYYTTNKSGGFFDSFTGAFVGTWFYHTLFGNNSDSSSNVNTDNATQENTDGGDTEEVFSISYWITNNLEYLKNLLFGVK